MIKLAEDKSCNGCHACANTCPKNCIKMSETTEGFLYPQINESNCVKCGLCQKSCPILNGNHNNIKTTPTSYAAYNKNEEIRLKSSSGGVFTLISEHIINSSGVVLGAGFDEKLKLKHMCIDNTLGLEKLRGSKYLQSIIGYSFKTAKAYLEKDRPVLFTGTPCQIGGLYSYLNKGYYNLFTQDIICHGVPSPKVFSYYIKFQEKVAKSVVDKVFFRDKSKGWRLYNVNVEFNNNSHYKKSYTDDLMMRAFLKDVCLRESCYNCSFKNINRQADITLADFWGIDNVMPQMNDNKGISLIVLNSQKGKDLFNSVKNNVIYKEVNLEKSIVCNPSMIKSVSHNKNRSNFFNDLEKLDFDKLINKYCKKTLLNKIAEINNYLTVK